MHTKGILLILIATTETQKQIMSDFNDNLRQQLQSYVERTGESYYKVAKESDVPTQIIYSLRGGSGVSAENAAKLVNYMGINLKSLIE